MAADPPWGTEWAPQPNPPKDSRFKKGQSGNPKGRPPGRTRKSLLLEKFESQGVEVAQVVVDAAKAGDMTAANIVLQRLAPPLRPRAEAITFALDPTLPLTGQAQQVLVAVAAGEVDPDTGKLLIDCLSAFGGLRQVDELDARIAALENQAATDAQGGGRGGVMETDT